MNRLPFLAGALAGLMLATTLAVPAAHGAAASPPLQQQIDALLKVRQRPEPLPIDPPNPFVIIQDTARSALVANRPTATKAVEEPKAAPTPPAPVVGTSLASNIEVLGATAARLKMGGVMQTRDQMQIVVNDVPRREGDFIVVNWNNTTVALKVVRIQPGLLVLRYEDAEMMLKF